MTAPQGAAVPAPAANTPVTAVPTPAANAPVADVGVAEVNVGSTDEQVLAQPEIKVDPVAKSQEDTRKALAIGISVATFVVGLLYLAAPLFVDAAAWDRASSPFQVVFTAMVGLAGSAIGYYFTMPKT